MTILKTIFPDVFVDAPPQVVVPLWIYFAGLIVPIVISIIGVIIGALKTPFEIGKTKRETDKDKSDYSLNLQQIADNATEESRKLREDLAKLRDEFEAYKSNTEADVARVTEMEKHIGDIEQKLTVAVGDSKRYRDAIISIVQRLKELTEYLEVALDDRKDEGIKK